MIAITSFMFHRLEKLKNIGGSFCVRESTFNCKYEGKQQIDEEILFDYETGATALVKMLILSVEKQKGITAKNISNNDKKQKPVLPYLINAHFDLIRVIDKGGDISTLFWAHEGVKTLSATF